MAEVILSTLLLAGFTLVVVVLAACFLFVHLFNGVLHAATSTRTASQPSSEPSHGEPVALAGMQEPTNLPGAELAEELAAAARRPPTHISAMSPDLKAHLAGDSRLCTKMGRSQEAMGRSQEALGASREPLSRGEGLPTRQKRSCGFCARLRKRLWSPWP